jgi:hypothetical protein
LQNRQALSNFAGYDLLFRTLAAAGCLTPLAISPEKALANTRMSSGLSRSGEVSLADVRFEGLRALRASLPGVLLDLGRPDTSQPDQTKSGSDA